MNVDDRLGNQDVDAAALFAAARSFRPSTRGRRRVLRALGLPIGLSLFGSSLAHAAYLLSSALKGWAIVAGVAATVGVVGSVAYVATAPSHSPRAGSKQRSSERTVATAAPSPRSSVAVPGVAVPIALPSLALPSLALPSLDQAPPSRRRTDDGRGSPAVPSTVVSKSRHEASAIDAAPAPTISLGQEAARSVDRLPPERSLPPPPPLSRPPAAAALALAPPPFRASSPGATPVPHEAAGGPALLPAATSGSSPLKGELALVAEGQERLRAGDAPGAFAALDRHVRLYPGGALAEEVELLRVRALVARGDALDAREAAQNFLQRHPASPLGSRVRSLMKALDVPVVP